MILGECYIIAEYIVKMALGLEEGCRIEWDDYDLITPEGIKIEVKSAAYIQSWSQQAFSKISFYIGKSKSTRNYERKSDYYVFCLLDCKNQNEINPLNLNQWTFYVTKTNEINDKLGRQQSITLSALLRKLQPVGCTYLELDKFIK